MSDEMQQDLAEYAETQAISARTSRAFAERIKRTPPDAEAVAREEVVMCYHPSTFSEAEFLTRLDAYRAAVAEDVERRVRAECGEDTKRLDWIERNEAETVFTGDTSGDWCVRYGKISVSTLRKSNRADADSLRDAIDAAMEAQP